MSNKKTSLKVLMPAAEASPLAKVGGLADVVGSLPLAIKKLGVDIRVIIPLYGSIDKKKYQLKKIYSDLEIPSGRIMIKINVWKSFLPGSKVIIYFIDAPDYFKYQQIYIDGDNSERFLFFSLASLYALPIINFAPDIIHCQDSHTALIPDIIKTSNLEYIKNLKTLYTLHNYRYQGKTRPRVLSTGNLSKDSLQSLLIDSNDGDINFMAQGVLNADIINTVSPTYAKEITTSTYGAGLEQIIRKREKDLYGILNGIDTKFFNPQKDSLLKFKYSRLSLDKKTKNKLAIQKEFGLPQNKKIALAGLVSRLAWQKGLDLFDKKISQLDCQFIFLGNGQTKYEEQLKKLAQKYPDKISVKIMFDIGLAQRIYGGADIFLMPSRFEPCGLGQMIAMRYGTIPLVRKTGGLIDTVRTLKIKKAKQNSDFKFTNKTRATGFNFETITSSALIASLKDALQVYYQHPKIWKKLQLNGMKQDFSWKKSAKEYLNLYKKTLNK